jgi:hypothetical protein
MPPVDPLCEIDVHAGDSIVNAESPAKMRHEGRKSPDATIWDESLAVLQPAAFTL